MLIQPIDIFVYAWLIVAVFSAAYVAWDQFHGNPEPVVMKWGFVLVTLYMGPIGLLLYVMADKEPTPGGHEEFIKPLWKQGVGSTVHCVAGDATGIIVAAVAVALIGLPMWLDLIVEYTAGFLFGLLIFQALFMRKTMGGTYGENVRRSFLPELISMNCMMGGMAPVMVLLMMGRDMRAMWPGEPLFWMVMSLGVIAGFAIAYPVNVWMVARGLKHGLMTERGNDASPPEGKAGKERPAKGDDMAGMDHAAMSMGGGRHAGRRDPAAVGHDYAVHPAHAGRRHDAARRLRQSAAQRARCPWRDHAARHDHDAGDAGRGDARHGGRRPARRHGDVRPRQARSATARAAHRRRRQGLRPGDVGHPLADPAHRFRQRLRVQRTGARADAALPPGRPRPHQRHQPAAGHDHGSLARIGPAQRDGRSGEHHAEADRARAGLSLRVHGGAVRLVPVSLARPRGPSAGVGSVWGVDHRSGQSGGRDRRRSRIHDPAAGVADTGRSDVPGDADGRRPAELFHDQRARVPCRPT